jgi:hypothetical protein
MVEAALIQSLHTLVETLDYDMAMSTRTPVRTLLKVVARSSALGMKIPRSIYGWTRFFLKALSRSYVFSFVSSLYHRNNGSLMKVMSQGWRLV